MTPKQAKAVLPENERRRLIGRFGLKLGLRVLGGQEFYENDHRGDFYCPDLQAFIEAKMSGTRQPVGVPESQFLAHYERALESGERRLYFVVRYSSSGKRKGVRTSPLKESARTAEEIEAYLWKKLRAAYLVDILALYGIAKARPKRYRVGGGHRLAADELKFRVNVGDLRGLTSGDPEMFAQFGLSLRDYEWGTKTVQLAERQLTMHTLIARPEVLERIDDSFNPAEFEASEAGIQL